MATVAGCGSLIVFVWLYQSTFDTSLAYSTPYPLYILTVTMGNKVSLEDEMINLRIVSKQMQRSAKKCEKNEKQALDKLKKVSTTLLLDC